MRNGKLEYSTYLGGSGVEGAVRDAAFIFADDSNPGNCVAVDANGLVYVSRHNHFRRRQRSD